MRKIFLFIIVLCAVSAAWGTPVTVTKTAKDLGTAGDWSKNTAYATAKLDDVITVTVTPGTGSSKNGMYYTGDYTDTHDWRMYQARANGQFAISAAQGYVITSVTLNYAETNTGIISTSIKESHVATPAANQIISGTAYPFANSELTFYVGNTTAATTNGQARIRSFSVTYEKAVVEEEFRDPVGDTLWNHNTAATTKLGTYGEWEMEGIRHTNPSNDMDRLKTNNTPGVGIGWAVNPHMQTTAEGGVKALSFLWNQGATAKENDKTEKITVTVGDKTKYDTFIGTETTNRPGDRTFLFYPEVKSNATLRLEGVNGNRIVVGPITITPYLLYTTKSHTIDVLNNGDDPTWTNTDLIDNTEGDGTIVYSVPEGNGVATIDSESGEVTAVGNGITTVTATWTPADALEGEEVTTTYELEIYFLAEKITLTVEDFTVTKDGDWIYDETEKRVNVELSQEYEKPSAENITVYYNNDKTVKPIDLGTYQVYIDIEETDTYAAVTGITSDAWKFTIIDTLSTIKEAAKEEIDTAVEGVTDEDILAIANTAKTNVDNAATVEEVDSIKTQALADLSLAVKFYNRGYAAGYARGQAEAFGEMGTPCDDCPAVEVTKGTKTIRLYNPDKVEFKKE